ncbi:hypothetical protein [Kribbella antibiotica]|uniref:lariocidin/triculamin family lasso peptide core domain n=1 Tax=Kribbella antibiotica TaxID=190195 RepID=UPI001405477D|nr:hypothetical protein [Kribbella antibiotica]
MSKKNKPGDGSHGKGVKGGGLYAAYAESDTTDETVVEKVKALVDRTVKLRRS